MLGAVRLRAAAGGSARRRLSTYLAPPSWDTRYLQLMAYREAAGDCRVPHRFETDGAKLGQWVQTQRKAYKTGKLRPERVERLKAVAFVWNVLADEWDAHFEQLTAYRAAHGDCAVPYGFAAGDGAKLGIWVHTQRKAYKAGKMSPDRAKRLAAVAFVWDVYASWDAHFELLTAYRAAHSDCAVPYHFATADGTMLGCWVSVQRHAYKTGEMSPEHIERLEAVAFVWDAHADGWDTHFELLTGYHAAHGDCAVPRSFAAADGTMLGYWVSTQREAYKAGELRPERVERLKAVAFVWDVLADGWDAHFEQLTAYRAAHGNCAVPYSFAAGDGTNLGRWVRTQQEAHKFGKMRPDRVERLEAVGFAW
ncbi:helicase associated domain-containing protein [Pelagophyceae sp. CCMP2097]|nr:helicase associated domain-containing protein [Pelagophyceae sp. CCMP2097]